MRRRKKAAAGRRKPEFGEQIAIPVTGNPAQRQLGAMKYLAVLAYPACCEPPKQARSERAKRKKFIEAVRAVLAKEAMRPGYPRKLIPKKYSQFREKRIQQCLTRTFRRILRWRIPAGIAANWMLMDGAPYGWAPVSGKIPLRPMSLKEALQEIGKQIRQHDGTHLEGISAQQNLRRRIWGSTLPVLHLVTPVARWFSAVDDPMDLIYDPSWVRVALWYAAILMEYLPPKIPCFNPNKAIRFLPQ